jgi:MATE family multidrug resistance protein
MADAIFAWAGHDPAQQALEADYFRCLCFAAPGFLVTAAVTGFFAGLGNTRTVLAVTGIGFAVNGILAWLWIFGRCGFPEAGIAGAGWAAVSATSVSALAALALFFRPEQERRFRTRSGWRLAWPLMVRLLRYGLPNGLLVALETLAFTLFVTFVGRMGQAELNATSIAFTLNLLAYFPVMGIAQASGVLVSQRLGEDRPDLAERSVWTSLRLALGLTACLASAYVLVPGLLVGAFESYENAEYWKKIAGLAVILLRFVAVYCFFDAANLVFSFSLRGAGDTIFVSIGTLALSLPMMAGSWESAERGWGVYIPWAFASLFPVCCALLFGWRFRRGGWRTRRIIGKENG